MSAFKVLNPNGPHEASASLTKQGYVIFERVLSQERLHQISSECDALMARERETPFDPGDGPE